MCICTHTHTNTHTNTNTFTHTKTPTNHAVHRTVCELYEYVYIQTQGTVLHSGGAVTKGYKYIMQFTLLYEPPSTGML